MKPVCLVLGAGAGIGGNVAKKFSKEGFHLCICRRTDEKGLNNLVKNIEDNGCLLYTSPSPRDRG